MKKEKKRRLKKIEEGKSKNDEKGKEIRWNVKERKK